MELEATTKPPFHYQDAKALKFTSLKLNYLRLCVLAVKECFNLEQSQFSKLTKQCAVISGAFYLWDYF